MSPAFWVTYFERLAIVAVVLTAVYLFGRKLRDSRLFARGGRRLNVVESMMLSPHAVLHIVRVGRRHFLVGSGSAGITRVAELPDTDMEMRAGTAPERLT
jgi:flagellar biogenesis protein FliO